MMMALATALMAKEYHVAKRGNYNRVKELAD